MQLEEQKKEILHWMYDFIEGEEDSDYSKSDVLECDHLLTNFISDTMTSSNRYELDWISIQIKELVLKLNELNERCDECLIETDQREGICELIFTVMSKCGHSIDSDITEEWREW